ncbi:MAG: TrbI/VirB10 family protein [Phascolarctobacterium sp.]
MRRTRVVIAILVALSSTLITGIANSEPPFTQSDENGEYRYDQNKKREHLEFYRQDTNEDTGSLYRLEKLKNPYTVLAGTIIPGVLINGMNSDLPGTILGQVSKDVYDTVTGEYLLIPKGTKLIGIYDTDTAFAQTRGAVIWQRMVLPNGDSMVLPNFAGSDKEGYSGFKDKKRSHYARVVWSSLLGAAAIGGLAAAADDNSDKNTFRENATQEMESNMSSVVNRIVDRNLNIAPTIIIRPGYKFNIIVDKDLILRPYEEEEQ